MKLLGKHTYHLFGLFENKYHYFWEPDTLDSLRFNTVLQKLHVLRAYIFHSEANRYYVSSFCKEISECLLFCMIIVLGKKKGCSSGMLRSDAWVITKYTLPCFNDFVCFVGLLENSCSEGGLKK
jgi:hypothetical protein